MGWHRGTEIHKLRVLFCFIEVWKELRCAGGVLLQNTAYPAMIAARNRK